jgi:DNA anti-recombination protein RmuC
VAQNLCAITLIDQEVIMTSEEPAQPPTPSGSGLRNILFALALVYVLASVYFFASFSKRTEALEQKQVEAMAQIDERLAKMEANTKAAQAAISEQLGMTQKELEERAENLRKEQRASESRLAQQQKQQISSVSSEVAGVKTEVGTVRTDVASTKSDLEATKAKLERALGDLGIQSGLIARTREDLEELRRRGDRNYFEFTLNKKQRVPVSTVSLELKKSDQKKGKFTLNVLADDKVIEKKDKTVFEPVQFYTGRQRQLYELVVLSVDKNKVTGYLSTPK